MLDWLVVRLRELDGFTRLMIFFRRDDRRERGGFDDSGVASGGDSGCGPLEEGATAGDEGLDEASSFGFC